ncbi:15662_t:CDS:2, partial [Acaulospora morrowiae]
MSIDFTAILLRDLSQLLEKGIDYNVLIQVGEEPNVKSFKAHSGILRARCPYFQAALSETWVKQEDGIILFSKPNISAEIFEIILRYIYTGKIALEQRDGADILGLLIAADELILHDLFGSIQQHLIIYKSQWMHDNFSLMRKTVFQNDRLKKLQDFCVDRICKKPELLFNSDDYGSVNLNVLLRVLQRDDLQLDEIEVWNYLIQWGIHQTSVIASPNSPKDLTELPISEWSTKHLATLRSTIQQCVPLVRMFQISSKDFYSKVMPYQSVLPPALYEDVMRYYMVPDCPRPTSLMPARRGGVESNLLRAKHVALISSWIDRNDLNVFYNATSIPYEYSNIPYEFKLLLRGSRDGFSPQAFHTKCDFQGATLLVLKVHGTGHLIGGYNPLNWDSTNKWDNTKDSFLFSLGDGEDIRNSILSRIQEYDRAVLCSQAIGACFGSGDLVMGGTHSNFNVELGCSCKRQSYERPVLNANHDRFSVDEYEVFKIIPKF